MPDSFDKTSSRSPHQLDFIDNLFVNEFSPSGTHCKRHVLFVLSGYITYLISLLVRPSSFSKSNK